ncbi:MAG: glycosyltransferase family 2 protein [bacterium]|nr:glycosyltransferase family 2 protein [bacterium]
MNPCLLVPVYDHGEQAVQVIADLAAFDLPCVVVDDGSDASTKQALSQVAARSPWVRLETRSSNGGKGAALKTGYRLAHRLGFSHVIQLDADGQHDTDDIPRLLELAKAHPEAMILADPVFENAPLSRLYGRRISRFWVWVECRSTAIHDPLCGFRCLPLEPLLAILDRNPCGDHMDFDPEIAVRLVWEGVAVVNFRSRISYDSGGVSHFNMLWDNVRISWLHTRLVFGMLARLLEGSRSETGGR